MIYTHDFFGDFSRIEMTDGRVADFAIVQAAWDQLSQNDHNIYSI